MQKLLACNGTRKPKVHLQLGLAHDAVGFHWLKVGSSRGGGGVVSEERESQQNIPVRVVKVGNSAPWEWPLIGRMDGVVGKL